MTAPNPIRRLRLGGSLMALAALAACAEPLDFDLRGRLGGSVDTSEAARNVVADRPAPDNRGIISYPGYQVAIAQRGDTLAVLADRIGLPAAELARYNGIKVDDSLRVGEVVALPRRVAEPSAATGAVVDGPLQPPAVDVTTLAGAAIDRADPTTPAAAATATAIEPVRHQVKRGETAFTIARLYDVSVRTLAEWNGLDQNFTLREGQFLLIPTSAGRREPIEEAVISPGVGSPTPVPPSAATPLPAVTPPPLQQPEPVVAETPAPAPEPTPAPTPPAPEPEPVVADIGQASTASNAAMSLPVQGSIVRDYARGRNNGIAIAASPGTSVKAAASGEVAHVGNTSDGMNFLLIRHPDGIFTAYMFVDDIAVNKGDSVSRNQTIAKAAPGDPGFVEFQVRKGTDPVDPNPYLQ